MKSATNASLRNFNSHVSTLGLPNPNQILRGEQVFKNTKSKPIYPSRFPAFFKAEGAQLVQVQTRACHKIYGCFLNKKPKMSAVQNTGVSELPAASQNERQTCTKISYVRNASDYDACTGKSLMQHSNNSPWVYEVLQDIQAEYHVDIAHSVRQLLRTQCSQLPPNLDDAVRWQ